MTNAATETTTEANHDLMKFQKIHDLRKSGYYSNNAQQGATEAKEADVTAEEIIAETWSRIGFPESILAGEWTRAEALRQHRESLDALREGCSEESILSRRWAGPLREAVKMEVTSCGGTVEMTGETPDRISNSPRNFWSQADEARARTEAALWSEATGECGYCAENPAAEGSDWCQACESGFDDQIEVAPESAAKARNLDAHREALPYALSAQQNGRILLATAQAVAPDAQRLDLISTVGRRLRRDLDEGFASVAEVKHLEGVLGWLRDEYKYEQGLAPVEVQQRHGVFRACTKAITALDRW